MIGTYGRTYPEFYTGDTGVRMAEFPDIVRSLAHYLYAGPNAVKYGLYQKHIDIMAIEFKRPASKIRAALGALASIEYAFYDEPTGYIWIPQCVRYQLGPLPWKRTDYNIKAARKWYANVGRNPFIGEFFDRWDKDLWLSDPAAWPGTEVQRREWVGETRIIVDAAESTALATRGEAVERRRVDLRAIEADFEQWWVHYPTHKKKGKIAARAEWMKLRPSLETPLEAMIAKLEEQKRSKDWQKDGGQFVPDPERYIKKGRWLDEGTGAARTSLSRHNEGTLSTLMEMAEEDGIFGEAVDPRGTSEVPKRVGPSRDRH